MKKKINPFIFIPIAFTVIAVIAISSVLIYNYSLGYKVKEHTKSGEITAIEYNGKTYHQMEALAGEYYKLILDEKISQKNNTILPHTYYTLKNDKNNDFLYSSAFRDRKIYTSLPINSINDMSHKNVTAIMVCQEGWNYKKKFVNDNEIIDFCIQLKEVKNKYLDNFVTDTFKKNTGNWYYLYYSFDNSPICNNDGILIAEYDGRFYLEYKIDDDTFTGIAINCPKLEGICNSFPKNLDK